MEQAATTETPRGRVADALAVLERWALGKPDAPTLLSSQDEGEVKPWAISKACFKKLSGVRSVPLHDRSMVI